MAADVVPPDEKPSALNSDIELTVAARAFAASISDRNVIERGNGDSRST